MILKTYFN